MIVRGEARLAREVQEQVDLEAAAVLAHARLQRDHLERRRRVRVGPHGDRGEGGGGGGRGGGAVGGAARRPVVDDEGAAVGGGVDAMGGEEEGGKKRG